MTFQFPILITITTVLICQALSLKVSQSRYKNNIKAPAISGHPDFERAYRTHLNFLENLVLFLPLVWIGSLDFEQNIFYTSSCILWVLGRIVFSYSYLTNTNFKIKLFGNAVAILANMILLILAVMTAFIK